MRGWRFAVIALVFLLVATLAAPANTAQAQVSGPRVVVTAQRLNVRSGPGPTFGVLGVVSVGAEMPLVGRLADNSWWQVDSPFGRGWVSGLYTAPRGGWATVPVVSYTQAAAGAPVVATVTTYRLNVREGPSAAYSILGDVGQGTQLNVVGRNSDSSWWQVDSPFGRGWVWGDGVTVGGNVASVPVATAPAATTAAPATTTQPATAPQAVAALTINTAVLNVRSGPGPTFAPIGTVTSGSQYTITGRNSDSSWWQIASPFGAGWVWSGLVIPYGDLAGVPVVATSQAPAAVLVTAWALNVRQGPGSAYAVLGYVYRGTQLQVVGRNSNSTWYQVDTPFGRGWVWSGGVQVLGPIGNVPVTG
jgi:N-acetylmuramoyl-L-alanine amidase